jgi:hypothetical protein
MKNILQNLKSNIEEHNSESLCEMIVVAQHFSFDNQIIVECMQELSKRRVEGENINFESLIKKFSYELKELDNQALDIKSILSQQKVK